MSSNRQLLEAGTAKRADLVKVWIQELHVEPGFNAPETPEEFQARVDGIVAHLANGGKLPPIEVRDRPEGGKFVVDGHARREGYIQADAKGIPVADPKDGRVYVLTIPFEGNDADRTLRIITSAESRTLSPLQTAAILKRLRAFGWALEDIARKINRTPERVRQLLALGDANTDVQQLVQSGEVSANVASQAVRQYGEKAGEVLQHQLEGVKAAGGKKLTPSKAKPPRPTASDLEQERSRLDWLVQQRAYVCEGGKPDFAEDAATRGYWVHWPEKGLDQPGLFPNARAAIDAAKETSDAQ
ncbi:hypothetical protein C8245_23065 [Paracidovorax avenae]|uniref:ParB/RepB/Spo0J family partition protein n=1 Tax=Paracidovorax avenae TaxID=80867 RepID=UPI000D2132E7|nr:ParB/RepB/Spo0J family partition protein [Paracidovorax avenae]AVS68158.1 hypothetical protein C8245_23065 [Paracidovorax avenae]